MNSVESARIDLSGVRQLRLFPLTPRDLCRKTGLNWITALRLHEQGLLSFNPAIEKDLDEAQGAELVFLGSLVAAGCDEEMLRHLLRKLRSPYQYSVSRIYYDWISQQWRLLPQPEEIDRDEFLQEWLNELVEQHGLETLRAIADSVRTAVKAVDGK